MCCSLDQIEGTFIIQDISSEKKGEYHLKGIYDRSPKNFGERLTLFFQRVELCEKIAEVADEIFHLLGSFLQSYTPVMVYQTLRNLHHAAHDIEHLLHTFCFLGDCTRLMTHRFFEYHDRQRTQFDYVRSAARVCHAVGHFLASANFLSQLKLCQFGKLEKVFKYAPLFNALGYALWTVSLIWRRHTEKHLKSDLAIHFGGCLFQGIPLAKTTALFASYVSIINKASAIAGIVHAWSVVQRLMPNDREEIKGHFNLPFRPQHHCQHHHHHAH